MKIKKIITGITTFLGLSDTPSSYSGQAGNYLRVTSAENAIEFAAPTGGLSVDAVTAAAHQYGALFRQQYVYAALMRSYGAYDPLSPGWRDVCWSPELGLLCAVGASGGVMTSPDGIRWTVRTAAAANTWNAVCWAEGLGLFVAVAETGTGNRVMTSPDGITWTARTCTDRTWRGVVWSPSLGILCATGDGYYMTSPDGVTWTEGSYTLSGYGVCWSPELGIFCAVGTASGVGAVGISTNGTTWNVYAVPNGTYYRVAWSPELMRFCSPDTADYKVLCSSDGVAWSSYPAPHKCSGIAWSPEFRVFYAAGTGTMFSWDGKKWISSYNKILDYYGGINIQSVAWANSLQRFVGMYNSTSLSYVLVTPSINELILYY